MNRYGLLGLKLGHSQSKVIHEYIFNKSGIDAEYDLIEITENELEHQINLLKDKVYCGYNVTIPYKEKVIPYLDKLSPAAEAIGAVNTIYIKDGLLIGDNTDYLGFMDELDLLKIDVENKDVYVLGSGGASKAICYAISKKKGNPIIVSRDKTKGITYDELNNIDNFDLIVNTTPVGMYPKISELVLPKEIIEKSLCSIDLICNPKETPFLKCSKNGYNGIYMLIFQAIHAEVLWNTNITFNINEIYKLL